jgi:hypothetical protein
MSDDDDRMYSTGEIALAMTIVFTTLTLPTLAGAVYYFFYL